MCAEMVFNRISHSTAFHIRENDSTRVEKEFKSKSRRLYIPYPADHPFLANKVLLLPEYPAPYGEVRTLIAGIQSFIHRYVDISSTFELIATHYVLLTWLYDNYNTLGYLRIRGDFGTGKTRFLQVIGALAYKPIFASGAATVAPLFHILNDIPGTLIMDESDFRYTNENALIVKILNNGNAVGFPVLRCEKLNNQSFTARSYSVFGPKILASRGRFDDPAVESRFLSETSGTRSLRSDIPLFLGDTMEQEAAALRNQLLQFRFDHVWDRTPVVKDDRNSLSPRMLQVIRPLLSFMTEDEQKLVRTWAKAEEQQQQRDRGMELPAHVLTVIHTNLKSGDHISIGAIKDAVLEIYGEYYDYSLTARAIGNVVRTTLGLTTRLLHGRHVVDSSQKTKVKLLLARFGI